MDKRKAQIDQTRAVATVTPSTANAEERTVEVVFATDAPVRRYDWRNDTDFNEVLSFAKGHVRMERLNNGAPVLNDHSNYTGVTGVDGQIGVVESARIEQGRGVAVIRLSKREEVEPIWQDIQDGIIRSISVGYQVHAYERSPIIDGETPTYKAVDWEPMEISLVPMPADVQSKIRGEESPDKYEVNIINNNNNEMEQEKEIQVPPVAVVPPVAPVAPVDTEAVRKAAVETERNRVKEINEAVRKAGLTADFAVKFIDNGQTLDECRAAIIDEFAAQDPNAGTRGTAVGRDLETEGFRAAMTDAILLRTATPAGEEVRKDDARMRNANQFKGMTLLEMAKRSLERRGVKTQGMDKMEVVGHALRAVSNTSDFPILLGNVLHKTLLGAYVAAADTWRSFCAVGTVSDFRAHNFYRTGGLASLDIVPEGAEYRRLAIGDGTKETTTAKTRGAIIDISRQMIINDDMGAFNRLATSLGRSAARSIEVAVYALLAENSGLGPTMSDTYTLFHANHGNIGGGDAIAEAALIADKVLMKSQMDINGVDYLDLEPNVLLVPIALEDTARRLNESQFIVNSNGNGTIPNLVNGLFRQVVGTPRLSGTRRYMFADPTMEPVIQVSFLDGNQNPYLEMQNEFGTDGVSWKVRHDFGVDAVGWRGAVTDAGA